MVFHERPVNTDFAGYTDEITPYSSNIEIIIHNLQRALEKMFYWFSTNHLVTNARNATF